MPFECSSNAKNIYFSLKSANKQTNGDENQNPFSVSYENTSSCKMQLETVKSVSTRVNSVQEIMFIDMLTWFVDILCF